MGAPRRFTIEVPETELQALRERLRATRLAPDFGNADWGYGVERGWLAQMITYWAEEYDWRRHEAEINVPAHYRVEIDGVPIHYLHVPGRGPKPAPLILTHGWPWTFWDWRKLIGPLSDPAAHGGDPADAFELIIPSLPGYIFSTPLQRTGIGIRAIGRLWRTLMSEVLGHGRFLAAGGDWGAAVSAELGHAHPDALLGVHLTLPVLPGLDPRSLRPADYAPDEAWMSEQVARARRYAYSHILVQAREPQTLAYALDDSPAGLAAWIWQRRRAWSDCDGEVERVFPRDDLCTTASLYWFTRSIGSAARLYAERARQGWAPLDDRARVIDVPTGFAVAPRELLLIPRRMAEERTNLTRWTILPRGGHFLPAEAPELLVEEYRAFARPLR